MPQHSKILLKKGKIITKGGGTRPKPSKKQKEKQEKQKRNRRNKKKNNQKTDHGNL
jgi:hypothetical protein